MKTTGLAALLFLALTSMRSGAQNASPPISLSIREAVLATLNNSPALKVQRMAPALRRTYEQEEEGAFDPELSAGLSHTWNASGSSGAAVAGDEETTGSAGLSTLLPTGTTLSGSLSAGREEQSWSGFEAEASQSLLKGAFPPVNLARVRQARIDTFSSRHELKGYTESLVADVEISCWDLYLAERQLEITRDSLALAERYLEETRTRIQVGRLAQIELAAAEAEVASRREALLSAESRLETSRLKLVRFTNPSGPDAWERGIRVTDTPTLPPGDLGQARDHVAAGLKMRPDLLQARLALERGELELIRTRNGILPRLDLFLSFANTAYADSIPESWRDLFKQPEVAAGLRFGYPLGNRAAEARNERATISRRQAEEALRNLELLAESEIRSVHLEARLAFKQIEATASLQALQEEKLRAETEKFRVGTSTTFMVAQAQRDLLNSRLAAVQATVACLQALVRLQRSEGSLLERRGIELPP